MRALNRMFVYLLLGGIFLGDGNVSPKCVEIAKALIEYNNNEKRTT